MAESAIKIDNTVLHRIFEGNVTSGNIDAINTLQIRQAYFASGVPFVGVWGILIVITDPYNHDVIEQTQITSKGIAVRHLENGTWTTWKTIALT